MTCATGRIKHKIGCARYTIEDAQNAAMDNEGYCLSHEYKNFTTPMEWKCSQGHEWKTPFMNIKGGSWCQKCHGNVRLTIEEMRKLAHSNGGECLSEKYVNIYGILAWRCQEGHEWEASAFTVKHSGTWCLICSGKIMITIEDMQSLAGSRGGECLSTNYINSITKLRWRCKEGHEWDSAPANLRNAGSWCPNCRFKNEQECRDICERLTKKKFPKKRPKFLEGLELDGFCEELMIGFEYQGEQHHKVIKAWHKNGEDDLIEQQCRDADKLDRCDVAGVAVIVIDYYEPNKLVFIADKLKEIFRARHRKLLVAWMSKKSSEFTILDSDPIWERLGL